LLHLLHNYSRGKSCTIYWATSVTNKKLPKANDRSIGENSPNLVTLFVGIGKKGEHSQTVCLCFVLKKFAWAWIFTPIYILQGCQMVCSQTQNPNLGKLCKALDWKMFLYFMAIWNILRTFGILYDPLVQFVFIWYIFCIMHHGKSGNPDLLGDKVRSPLAPQGAK
jgi:hypothetical protein